MRFAPVLHPGFPPCADCFLLPLCQPLRPAIKKDHRKVAFVSIGQRLSAFCTAFGKHFAAVAGRHPVAETVFAFSVNFLRLIRSKHNPPPFCMILIPDIIPYSHEDCQQFFAGKKNPLAQPGQLYIGKNPYPGRKPLLLFSRILWYYKSNASPYAHLSLRMQIFSNL